MKNSMKSLERLQHLPDHSRIWIYAADRSLDESEATRLLEHLDSFCSDWRSHGRPVTSGAALVANRFAVIAGEIQDADISGCGIDASVHFLDQAAADFDMRWLPALVVHYRAEDGTIHSVSRTEFRNLVRAGHISASTVVFDVSIQTLRELRDGRLEQSAGSTWHNRAFRLSEASI